MITQVEYNFSKYLKTYFSSYKHGSLASESVTIRRFFPTAGVTFTFPLLTIEFISGEKRLGHSNRLMRPLPVLLRFQVDVYHSSLDDAYGAQKASGLASAIYENLTTDGLTIPVYDYGDPINDASPGSLLTTISVRDVSLPQSIMEPGQKEVYRYILRGNLNFTI